MRHLLIVNGLSGDERKYVQQDNSLGDSRSNAKRYATILEADCDAAWLSSIYGVQLFATLATGEVKWN